MLRIGVVGAGFLGKIHIKLLLELPEFELVGCYDIDAKNASLVAKEYGIKAYESYENLLDRVDVIDIVTPTVSHHEYAAQAIKKGKHTFIEKPVTETSEQAKELCAMEKKHKVTVQVGHVERFNPAFVAIKPFVEDPLFIETHRLAEFNPRGTDVPVVLDLMIHDIDIVLNIVKSPIISIAANGVNVLSKSTDIASVRLEFENKCVANLTTSRISLKNMRKTRIFQKEAYITIDFLEKKASIIKVEEATEDPFAISLDLPEGKKQVLFENPKIHETNAIKEELKTFFYFILENKKPIVTLEDSRLALEVAERIITKIG